MEDNEDFKVVQFNDGGKQAADDSSKKIAASGNSEPLPGRFETAESSSYMRGLIQNRSEMKSGKRADEVLEEDMSQSMSTSGLAGRGSSLGGSARGGALVSSQRLRVVQSEAEKSRS